MNKAYLVIGLAVVTAIAAGVLVGIYYPSDSATREVCLVQGSGELVYRSTDIITDMSQISYYDSEGYLMNSLQIVEIQDKLIDCQEVSRKNFVEVQQDWDKYKRDLCVDAGGQYLEGEGYHECEGVDQIKCNQMYGTFNDCASACRHDPEAEVCIDVCVPVCEF